MVYCPNCQSDCPSDTMVCPDCRQVLPSLTKAASAVAEAPDDSWVTVAHSKEKKLVEKAKNTLDVGNIPSMIMPKSFERQVKSSGHSGKGTELSAAGEEKLLMVPREYKTEAKEILRGVFKNENLY